MISNIENIMTTDPKRLTGSNLKKPVSLTETPAPKKDLVASAKMLSSIRKEGGENGISEAITPAAKEDTINDAN